MTNTLSEDFGELFSRADGSHMTQMDVDGGRTLTIADVQQWRERKGGKDVVKPLIVWREDVRPWIVPNQEALLLKAIGWTRSYAIGKRLHMTRDPDVRFGPDVVGGSRIVGSPDIDQPATVNYRNGKKSIRGRRFERTPDPDPLYGLVVVRLGLTLEDVDRFTASKGGKVVPSQQTGQRRASLAAKLDTEDNRAALLTFARGTDEESAQ
jgi:hypothetical protein